MALIVSQDQDKDKDKAQAQDPGGINVSGTPAAEAAAPGAPAVGGQPAKGSGRFINLQRYLQANQGAGQQIAGKMGETVGRQGEQLGKDIESAKGVQSQLDAEKNRIAQAGGFAQQIAQDPRALAQNQQQLQQFQQLRTGQTGLQGIQQAADQGFGKAQTQLGQFQQAANLTGSEAGRFELLGQALGRPTYSRGQRRLDQLMVQAGAGDILGQLQRDVAAQTKAGEQSLGQARSDISGAISQTGDQAKAAQEQLLGALGRIDDPNTPENEAAGAFGGIDTQIGQAFQSAQQQEAARKASYDRIQAALNASGDVSAGGSQAFNALNRLQQEGLIGQEQFDELSELMNQGKLDIKRGLNINKNLLANIDPHSVNQFLVDPESGQQYENPNYNPEIGRLIAQGAQLEAIGGGGDDGGVTGYNLMGKYSGTVGDFLNQQDKFGYLGEADNIKRDYRKTLGELGYSDKLGFLKDYLQHSDPTQLQRQAFMTGDQSERLKALHTLAGTTPGQSLEMKDQPMYQAGKLGYDTGKAGSDIQRAYDYLYAPRAQQQQMEAEGFNLPRALLDAAASGAVLGPAGQILSGLSSVFGGGGLFGGGGGGLFSDENLKTNVKDGGQEVGKFLDSINAHSYDYKNPAHGKGKQLSVMAQELEKTKAGRSAVENTPEGKKVHYERLQSMMLAAQSDLHKRLKKLESK